MNISNENQKNSIDSRFQIYIFSVLAAALWSRNILVLYFGSILSRIPLIGSETAGIIIDVLIALLVLLALPYIFRRERLLHIIFYVCFVLFYQYSIQNAYNYKIEEYLVNNSTTILIKTVPYFFLGLCLDGIDFLKIFRITSRISIVVDTIALSLLRGFMVNSLNADVNLGYAYWLLPHVMLLLLYGIQNRNTLDIVLSITGGMLLLTLGARGPIVSIGVGLIFFILFILESKRKWLMIIIAVTIIPLLLLTQRVWIMILQLLFKENRILEMLASGEILYANGHDVVSEMIIGYINKNPISGYGMACDRAFVLAYSHNIVLEFAVSYGIPCAIILLTILFKIYVKSFRQINDVDFKIFYTVLFCGFGFFSLLISSSYLVQPPFYMLLGFCVSILEKNKKRLVAFTFSGKKLIQ